MREAETKRPVTPVSHALYSLLAIAVALIFLFPLYWGVSTSLRNPLDTFTVTGLGIPWINFSPTLNNWVSQLSSVEAQHALANSIVVSISATLLAIVLGTH